MAKIHINNPKQVINGGAKKYYFKVKGLGGPKGDKGDTGATGPQGPQGPQGNAATVSVGSTTTLPVGQDATVQNVGTLYNAVLNFGIPQGPRGPQGATGATGAKGDKGDQGNPGPQGEKGTNATVYIGTTTTGEPGTQARVYNSGTDSNAVLNFEIPRGDVGPSVPLVQETGYSTTKAMSQNATTEALNGKQNTLTAGSNITISGNTISAKDTTYTAGDNVQINGTVISATDTTYTAGANIQIENGTISATDTTYTAGNGLNLNGTEFSANTDVLATKEDLEDYYTKTEADNLLAPKLEAEVVTELPATGTEGKLYLTPKAHTTQTATGNPIEATVTEQAGQLESFQLDGDTFQQTYTGKNLYNVEAIPYVARRAYGSDGAELIWSGYTGTDEYQPVEPSTEYTLWNDKIGNTTYLCEYDENKNFIQRLVATRTFTTTATTKYLRWSLNVGTGEIPPTRTQLQLGSTVTSYEPYVGGQPSPNPDYPQPIQTVTGTQTITINGMDYPISLGSIELCKLGTYQDYIYKDGEDWKVHKATGSRTFDGTESWTYDSTRIPRVYLSESALNSLDIHPVIPSGNGAQPIGKITNFTAKTFTDFYTNAQGDGFAMSTVGKNIQMGDNRWTSRDGALAAIIGARWYYAQATGYETDTTITDTNLIAQLEAIRTASLENGTNTITNTATAPNLAGDMEIGYYGYNPTNRYDKFIWLDLNNNYEQIGGE